MEMPNKINVSDSIVRISIDKLKKYERNNKKHNQDQINKIKSSIEVFGFRNPVLVDKDLNIIAGHGRHIAATQLNMTELPCIIIDNLTSEQIKAFRIMDNKSAESEWDYDALKLEFNALEDAGFDLDLTGFTFDEMTFRSEKDEILHSYTEKIVVPTYEPTLTKPEICLLYDDSKYKELVSKIDNSNVPEEIKGFLRLAATRHIVFDYRNIANYYAHSNVDVQERIEDSALVIIDFDKAVEQGYVNFMKEIFNTGEFGDDE